jgi:hypothetical protein
MDWELATETEPRAFGLWSRAEIDKWTERQGVENNIDAHLKAKKSPDVPLAECRAIARGYRKQMTIKQLAKRYHRSQGTIIFVLNEMGVVIRPSHNRKER